MNSGLLVVGVAGLIPATTTCFIHIAERNAKYRRASMTMGAQDLPLQWVGSRGFDSTDVLWIFGRGGRVFDSRHDNYVSFI